VRELLDRAATLSIAADITADGGVTLRVDLPAAGAAAGAAPGEPAAH
jgi:hypothetical protein